MNKKPLVRAAVWVATAAAVCTARCADVPARLPAGTSASGVAVVFYDVGQGDAALCSHGRSHVLIDGGDGDHGACLAAALRAAGVETLAYAVLTHPHDDHYGGLPDVLKAIPVGVFLHNGMTGGSDRYQAFMRLVRDTLGVPDMVVRRGDTYACGGLDMTVLHPGGAPVAGDDSLNDNSVVCRVGDDAGTVLFTGDITARAESLLTAAGPMDPAADILKVPHHGSAYSSCTLFLEAVAPVHAVVSCGAGNSYGHPHAAALARYEALGIAVRRTDMDGDVRLVPGNTPLP